MNKPALALVLLTLAACAHHPQALTDPATGSALTDPATGQPITEEPAK